MTVAAEPPAELGPSRRRRMMKIVLWLGGLALFWFVLQLLGVDVKGWLRHLWDQITEIPPGYLIAALAAQTGATFFAGFSYYGILKAAYPRGVALWPVVAAYAVGVAINNFLPANIGTFVTLLMFVAVIPACTFAGSLAAYLVQKIFFTIAGTFVYLYMFLSVPGAFDLSFGNVTSHPALTTAIVLGGIGLLVVLARIFWREVKKLWAKAKQGGAILSQPRRYMSRRLPPVLPQLDLRPDRHRDLPRRVRAARDVRVGDVGDGLRLARERGVIHARRDRRDAGDERARAQDLLRCCQEPGGGLLDRAATHRHCLEPGRCDRPRRGRLRLGRRQAARQRVLRAGQGEER